MIILSSLSKRPKSEGLPSSEMIAFIIRLREAEAEEGLFSTRDIVATERPDSSAIF